MSFADLAGRLAHVRAEIAQRQARGGWSHPVTIVAVTKGFGVDAVQAALDAGLADIGENRVQEALDKMGSPVGPRATWHLIGHLQRNKAKLVPGRFVLVQKSGCAPADAPALARQIAAAGALALEGLMTLAPLTDDTDVQRRTFRGLRALRDQLKEDGLWVPTLSMGMSADYGTAVEEGATVIRLGTVLFGARTT